VKYSHMDLNHNSNTLGNTTSTNLIQNIPQETKPFELYPSQPGFGAFNSVVPSVNGLPFMNGCEFDVKNQSRVTVEEVAASRIPLTVTSPDDDVDSGTESIDSRDSDSSMRQSVGGESTENGKDRSDKKRPGRKKGQGKRHTLHNKL